MNSSIDPIPPMRSVQVDVPRSPTFILKIVEVVICFIVIGCFFAYVHSWYFFVASTTIGALFHSAALLICYGLQQTQIQKTYLEVMLNAWFALALFTCSILLMSTPFGAWVAGGIFSLFLTAVYGVDTYFAFKNLMATNPLVMTTADQVDGGLQDQVDGGLQPYSGVTHHNSSTMSPHTDPYSLHSPYNPPSTFSYQNDPPPYFEKGVGIPSKPGLPGV